MVKVPFVDLGAQYRTLATEVQKAIAGVLERGDFILGSEVGQFEAAFAAFCDTRFAVGVDSGTSALELALRAYSIGEGDEVITAANTFIATAFAISYTGARPVLVDIDSRTYNIDVAQIEAAITDRTRAIIPVHLYGQPADMDPILEIARRHRLIVIEDACQAHGARYRGQRAGSLGHAAAFSFYPTKNLGAYGDGGMVVTNDEDIARTLRMLRDYGQEQKYHHLLRGHNRRLDTLQAAVLRAKLSYIESWQAGRRQHAQRYTALLASGHNNELIKVPTEIEGAESVYHLYVVRVPQRDRVRRALQERDIGTGIHYPIPIHLQPTYKQLGYRLGSFPVTEACAEQILSLPMYAELTADAIDYVAVTLGEVVG